MGFLRQNNEIENEISFNYSILTPTRFFLNQSYSINFRYQELYKPKKFSNFRIDQSFNATFKNNNEYRYHMAFQPQNEHDYYESREENRVFITPALFHFCNSFSTSQNNRFQYSIFWAYNLFYSDFHNSQSYGLNFNPRFRINNKASIDYEFFYWKNTKDRGYVDKIDITDEIIFGERITAEMTNTIGAKFSINNKSNIDFRLRHYFSNAEYDKFFRLKENGYLEKNVSYNEDQNINYNAFNIDLVYSWNFAPGSFLNIVWKNSIYQNKENVFYHWQDNFKDTISAPQINSFSLKLLYYFDYAKFI